jgi:hypothetical protein
MALQGQVISPRDLNADILMVDVYGRVLGMVARRRNNRRQVVDKRYYRAHRGPALIYLVR